MKATTLCVTTSRLGTAGRALLLLWVSGILSAFINNTPYAAVTSLPAGGKPARPHAYRAKAYDAGRLDLFVLRATNPTTKAFVFKRKGTKLGHESEILFASGARLTLKAETLIRSNYRAAKYDHPDKEIPIYVLEVEVS